MCCLLLILLLLLPLLLLLLFLLLLLLLLLRCMLIDDNGYLITHPDFFNYCPRSHSRNVHLTELVCALSACTFSLCVSLYNVSLLLLPFLILFMTSSFCPCLLYCTCTPVGTLCDSGHGVTWLHTICLLQQLPVQQRLHCATKTTVLIRAH